MADRAEKVGAELDAPLCSFTIPAAGCSAAATRTPRAPPPPSPSSLAELPGDACRCWAAMRCTGALASHGGQRRAWQSHQALAGLDAGRTRRRTIGSGRVARRKPHATCSVTFGARCCATPMRRTNASPETSQGCASRIAGRRSGAVRYLEWRTGSTSLPVPEYVSEPVTVEVTSQGPRGDVKPRIGRRLASPRRLHQPDVVGRRPVP